MAATFIPACSKIFAISHTVVLLPFVPVTPITVSEREGNPYANAPVYANSW